MQPRGEAEACYQALPRFLFLHPIHWQGPCDRLLESKDISVATKTKLRKMRKQLNPFELKPELEKALKEVLEHAHPARRPTASLPNGQKKGTKKKATPVSFTYELTG